MCLWGRESTDSTQTGVSSLRAGAGWRVMRPRAMHSQQKARGWDKCARRSAAAACSGACMLCVQARWSGCCCLVAAHLLGLVRKQRAQTFM